MNFTPESDSEVLDEIGKSPDSGRTGGVAQALRTGLRRSEAMQLERNRVLTFDEKQPVSTQRQKIYRCESSCSAEICEALRRGWSPVSEPRAHENRNSAFRNVGNPTSPWSVTWVKSLRRYRLIGIPSSGRIIAGVSNECSKSALERSLHSFTLVFHRVTRRVPKLMWPRRSTG